MFNPVNHYWIVGGDDTQAFASGRAELVAAADADFATWKRAGNNPTKIDTFANLYAVLLAQAPQIAAAVAPGWAEAGRIVLPPVYIPAATVRSRLQDADLWDAAVSAMTPAQQLWFATLELGVSPTDPIVTGLLEGIGADLAVILAP